VFDWLFEGRTAVYVSLISLAAFLLVVWWQRRQRRWLVGVAVAASLIGLYALLDRIVETDREQIVRKVHEMANAMNARDLDALFANISDRFRSPGGKNKEELRDLVQHYVNSGMVENVKVWDIVCVERPSPNNSPVRVFFSAKAEGVREMMADCDATFDFDPQSGWRLRSVRLLQPQMDEEWQIQL
jgi:hypothetical protein